MKTLFSRLVPSMLLALAILPLRAAELSWLTDFPKAQTLAKAENKSVLLVFHGSDWCPACVEMQKQVFDSPEFIAYARRELILVDVDFPEKTKLDEARQRANLALKAKFNVAEGLPTVVLLDESGGTAFQENGYHGGGAAAFLPNLQRHARTAPAKAKYKNLSVDEFERQTSDKQNVILDVRTKSEFAAGHIAGAVNLDVNSPDFATKAAALDKGKTYLVHCAAGVRSAKACDKLAQLDFPNLYNLPGGFKAWEKAGKPVEK